MKPEIIETLQSLKQQFEPQGFIILGAFGSVARGEETAESDIDILYEVTEQFYNRYPGWSSVSVIDSIKKECEAKLGRKADLADKNALRVVGKKYILPEVVYVR